MTMPQPGDPCPGFIVDVGRCWRMVYDRNLQADHCYEAPSWTGPWFSPRAQFYNRPHQLRLAPQGSTSA